MNIGEILVYLNPLLILSAIYFGYHNLEKKNPNSERNFDSLSYLILGNQTFLLILLAYYFLTTNLKFEYVSDYSSEDLSIGYKLAGVWAGNRYDPKGSDALAQHNPTKGPAKDFGNHSRVC